MGHRRLAQNIAGSHPPQGPPKVRLRGTSGHVKGLGSKRYTGPLRGKPVDIWETRLATPRTFLLLPGSSVTERLRIAGNADWQEKRVPRCWPSVNGGTSGLESGAGKPPPLYCQVLDVLGSRSGPPQRRLRSSSRSLPAEPSGTQGRDSQGEVPLSSTAAPEVLAGGHPANSDEATTKLVAGGSNRRVRVSLALTDDSQHSRGQRSQAASSPKWMVQG
jgi:hypothetical protein